MLVATLIAADRLEKGEVRLVQDCLTEAGCHVTETGVIVDDKAADILFEGDVIAAREAMTSFADNMDIAVQPVANRLKKLLISDMDSTMITVECIDELASYAGIKDRIAAITERAMQGELDFEEALRGRVALLAGLDVAAIDKCLDEKVKIMPGAQILVRTMVRLGAQTILVSGGFTRFAEPVGKEIGFERFDANILEEADGRLTGQLAGPIVDSGRKAEILTMAAKSAGLSLDDCLAVGDGANDIPMIERAGMGVAYHAKPKAANAADVAIRHNDLTALLYLQGISARDWVTG